MLLALPLSPSSVVVVSISQLSTCLQSCVALKGYMKELAASQPKAVKVGVLNCGTSVEIAYCRRRAVNIFPTLKWCDCAVRRGRRLVANSC